DDRFKNIDDKLGIKFKNIDDRFADMFVQIKELVQENKELRVEMTKGFKEVATEIHAIRVDINRISEKQDSLHARVFLLEGARS
ncbi:MAG: hypothetical protein QM538_06700, partial [Methylacidiphilales bacterium]|nr:hypothetical protein [Candidatus Methylacidiphilales bacterium]